MRCCFVAEAESAAPGHGSPVQATASHSTQVYRRGRPTLRKKMRTRLRALGPQVSRRNRYSDDAQRAVHAAGVSRFVFRVRFLLFSSATRSGTLPKHSTPNTKHQT